MRYVSSWEYKSEGVTDGESGELTGEDVAGEGIGKSETEKTE